MASRWVRLFQGTLPEVITLQSSCEASGIPTFVPDMNIVQVDPFIRGGNAFAIDLLVPEDRLEDARTLVPERSVQEARPRNELEILGRRVRWCCLLLITAPIGIWFGLRYLLATRKLEVKPAEHAWTVAAFGLSLGVTLLWVAYYVFRHRRGF